MTQEFKPHNSPYPGRCPHCGFVNSAGKQVSIPDLQARILELERLLAAKTKKEKK